MTDELARLESALRATSPRAPAAARERAISEAMAAFDRHRQGSDAGMRHKGQVPARGTSWIRRLFAMPLSRPSLAFAGSAAVLVVAGIVSHQVLLAPPAAVPGACGADGFQPRRRRRIKCRRRFARSRRLAGFGAVRGVDGIGIIGGIDSERAVSGGTRTRRRVPGRRTVREGAGKARTHPGRGNGHVARHGSPATCGAGRTRTHPGRGGDRDPGTPCAPLPGARARYVAVIGGHRACVPVA